MEIPVKSCIVGMLLAYPVNFYIGLQSYNVVNTGAGISRYTNSSIILYVLSFEWDHLNFLVTFEWRFLGNPSNDLFVGSIYHFTIDQFEFASKHLLGLPTNTAITGRPTQCGWVLETKYVYVFIITQLGYVNKCPTMHFLTRIPKNTILKSYML